MFKYKGTVSNNTYYVFDTVATKKISTHITEMEAGLAAYEYIRKKLGKYTSGDIAGIVIIKEGNNGKD